MISFDREDSGFLPGQGQFGVGATRFPPPFNRLLATAPVGEIEMMLGRMEKALVAIGFLSEATSGIVSG